MVDEGPRAEQHHEFCPRAVCTRAAVASVAIPAGAAVPSWRGEEELWYSLHVRRPRLHSQVLSSTTQYLRDHISNSQPAHSNVVQRGFIFITCDFGLKLPRKDCLEVSGSLQITSAEADFAAAAFSCLSLSGTESHNTQLSDVLFSLVSRTELESYWSLTQIPLFILFFFLHRTSHRIPLLDAVDNKRLHKLTGRSWEIHWKLFGTKM